MDNIQKLKKRRSTATATIIIVALLTAINTVLIAVNADTVFTFSAYFPQLIVAASSWLADEVGIKGILYIGVAIALFISLIYLLLWLGARKKDAFITVTLVIFGIDTALLLYDTFSYFDASGIIDIVFHAWVIIDLVLGITACKKLKNMPIQDMEDSAVTYINGESQVSGENPDYLRTEQTDSMPIGLSENKGRVIISVEYNGMNVEVRRSKGLTELIVDGKVYAEQKGIIETQYTLTARVSGVEFSASMVNSVMFLFADGEQIAKKIRLI